MKQYIIGANGGGGGAAYYDGTSTYWAHGGGELTIQERKYFQDLESALKGSFIEIPLGIESAEEFYQWLHLEGDTKCQKVTKNVSE